MSEVTGVLEGGYMNLWEFRDLGFIQELNRRFLHKHGLALALMTTEEAIESGDPNGLYLQIVDSRDDPEGIAWDEEYLKENAERFNKKKESFDRLAVMCPEARYEALGYVIQPIPFCGE